MDFKKWIPYAGWIVAAILAIALFNSKYTIQEKSNTVQQTQEATTSNNYHTTHTDKETTTSHKPTRAVTENQNSTIPLYVLEVLDYVRSNKRAMDGYVGGRKFMNREKQLPKTDATGAINYQEWDVLPKEQGKNRGAERLVTGSNNTAYYTSDHYQSFTPIP